jgi:hypothetical protein
MKKYIKQIVALTLIVSFASCSPDEKLEMLSAGGSVSGAGVATPGSISRLDNSYLVPLAINTKEGVSTTKIEIYKNTAANASAAIILGAKVSDAVIAADGKTATYNTSTLGSFDVFPTATAGNTGTTGTFPLAIVSTFSDGTVTTIPYIQTVGKGIVWKILDADGNVVTNATSGVSSFKLNDPTPVKLRFAVVTKTAAKLTSIVGQWTKTTAAGVITTGNLPGAITPLDTKTKTVDIAAIPYSTYGGLVIGDVITYRFTVTAGTQTDFITTKVKIVTQTLGDEKAATLSDDSASNKFSLKTGLNYANSNTTDGEVVFTTPFGISKEGATVIDFVKSNTTPYDTADLFKVQADYNAGTKVTSLTGLAKNDVVLYKIVRGTGATAVTSYGMIKVGDVNTTILNAITTNSFGIVYKEGSFL